MVRLSNAFDYHAQWVVCPKGFEVELNLLLAVVTVFVGVVGMVDWGSVWRIQKIEMRVRVRVQGRALVIWKQKLVGLAHSRELLVW